MPQNKTLIFIVLSLFLIKLPCFSQNNTNLNKDLGVFTVTAYCSCVKCCGKWSKYNKTASGDTPKQGITIAAPRNIPFKTKLLIENVGIRTVQDRLAKKYDSRIDVYFTNHNDALTFGKKQLKVKIVNN